MTEKEFQDLLSGKKKVRWSDGRDNEKLLSGKPGIDMKDPYRNESKKMIEKQRKRKAEKK